MPYKVTSPLVIVPNADGESGDGREDGEGESVRGNGHGKGPGDGGDHAG